MGANLTGGNKGLSTTTQWGPIDQGTGLLPLPQSVTPGLQGQPNYYYQVHILGEVGRPGTYRFPASTRLFEAVQTAGIMERGSSRRIELRREGNRSQRVDLLAFKLLGDLDANPYILDNDVIFVPLTEKIVEIQGSVRRPGQFELTKEKTLEDLIHLAGGFSSGVANPDPIKVVRFEHGKKQLMDVGNTEKERREFILQNADLVVVPYFLTVGKKFDYNFVALPGDNGLYYPTYESRVFVLGSVASPGPYPFNPYYNVRQYLTLAGGTTRAAKTHQIKIITAAGKTTKVSKDSQLNPGDTIIVPEKYLPPESILSLTLGVTTSILGITTAVVTLTR